MIAAAAALAGLHHDDRKGGRGRCYYCGEWENNVSYHQAWECPKRVQKAPDEKVETQLKVSAAMQKVLDIIPTVSQEEFVRMLTQR